jgi:Fe-Mn family superoxide dismutase
MEPKKYQFGNIAPELSVKMFEDHSRLYESGVERLNSCLAELSNPYDPELTRGANCQAGHYRDLENNKTYLTNLVILHELFFENVILPPGSPPMPPGPMMQSLIQEHFPQVKVSDFWSHIIKPTASAARGWCILGWDTVQAKLDVTMMDDDDGPCIVGLYPLMVIDVFEHSYTQQYGIDRGTYLDHLQRSINWNVVEHRVAMVHSAAEMMRTAIPEQAEEYIRELQEHREDTEFGFPDEKYFPDAGTPPGTGIDTRQDTQISQNPRIQSSVVTQADLQQSYDRIKLLSQVTFSSSFEDMFDEEVRGKSPEFREILWAKLHEDEE